MVTVTKERVTLTGTLRVLKQRKRQGGLLEDFIVGALEIEGLVETRYWPFLFVFDADEPHKEPAYARQRGFMYQWKGRGRRAPAALQGLDSGARLRVVATIEEWSNGCGGFLTRSVIQQIISDE